MCGRYVIADPSKIPAHYHIPGQFNPIPNYNAAPGQILPVIIQDEQGENHIEPMIWGLIPSWAKDPSIGFKMINVRTEALQEKPSYKALFHHKRCLIPFSGIYEWSEEGKDRIPYYITSNDGELLSAGGLYDIWTDPTGAIHPTFTIITDNYKPIIIEKHNQDFWLNPRVLDIKGLLSLLKPYPSKKLKVYRVSSRVNSPRNNDEFLIKPETNSGDKIPT
jgi:putative SOS response-associated peptidase YedK